jgi:hypothetical protein
LKVDVEVRDIKHEELLMAALRANRVVSVVKRIICETPDEENLETP